MYQVCLMTYDWVKSFLHEFEAGPRGNVHKRRPTFFDLPTMSDDFYPMTSNIWGLFWIPLSTYLKIGHHLWMFPSVRLKGLHSLLGKIHGTFFYCFKIPFNVRWIWKQYYTEYLLEKKSYWSMNTKITNLNYIHRRNCKLVGHVTSLIPWKDSRVPRRYLPARHALAVPRGDRP